MKNIGVKFSGHYDLQKDKRNRGRLHNLKAIFTRIGAQGFETPLIFENINQKNFDQRRYHSQQE
jgi:hypothetical protein